MAVLHARLKSFKQVGSTHLQMVKTIVKLQPKFSGLRNTFRLLPSEFVIPPRTTNCLKLLPSLL